MGRRSLMVTLLLLADNLLPPSLLVLIRLQVSNTSINSFSTVEDVLSSSVGITKSLSNDVDRPTTMMLYNLKCLILIGYYDSDAAIFGHRYEEIVYE